MVIWSTVVSSINAKFPIHAPQVVSRLTSELIMILMLPFLKYGFSGRVPMI